MMKRIVTFMAFAITAMLTACAGAGTGLHKATADSEIGSAVAPESPERTSGISADTTATEQPEQAGNKVKAPQKSEVTAMKDMVLEGMSEEDITALCSVIKAANHTIEQRAIYDNLFDRLSKPGDLTWNYFDQSGEIQIGWACDGDISIQEVMATEGLTEDEAYAKYGGKVITYNEYSAEDFAQMMEKIRDTVTNNALRRDLQQIIDETRFAAKTHDVAHVEKLYHILHDMDYFLLNYRLDTEGEYIRDKSTISRYYGALSLYAGSQESGM